MMNTYKLSDFPPPEYVPTEKQKCFIENMKRIAKEFHLEIVWKQNKDERR